MTSSQRFFSILRRDRSMHIAVLFSGLTTLACFALFFVFSNTYSHYLSVQVAERVNNGMRSELARLSAANDDVAATEDLKNALESGDAEAIKVILANEATQHSIGPMSVVSNDGYTLHRTRDSRSQGDNIFLNTAIGRTFAAGGTATSSVEQGTRDAREILFIAGRTLDYPGQDTRVLFATYLANDAFVDRLAKEYIGFDARIAFYTHEYGIFGSNIKDEQNRRVLDSNIQANSDWMEHADEPIVFRYSGGQIFLVKNVPLHGIESMFGGVAVFIPLWPLFILAGLVVIVPFLVFILVCMLLKRRSLGKVDYHRYFVAAYILGISGMVATIFLFIGMFRGMPSLHDYQYPLYNSTLRIQPDSGIFNSNSAEQKVSVVLDSGGEPINAISFDLAFDPQFLSVESVSVEDSICTLFLVNDVDPRGFVRVECIIPNPGFEGKDATVASMYVKSKKSGITSMEFSSSTEVLANDGLGTNVLRFATGASYNFTDTDAGMASSTSPTLTVVASSHLNEERWYQSKMISLFWLPGVPVEISITDEKGFSTTTIYQNPPAKIPVVNDGIYKLSIREVNRMNGEVSLITAHVDATAPEDVYLSASTNEAAVGDLVRFTAHASDAKSGLQRTKYLRIDDKLFFPIGNEIHIPFFDSGVHTVTLRAYDKAGNYTDSTIEITVRK